MGTRVLFVDDEADPDGSFVQGNYLTYYQLKLKEAGYEVAIAPSEQEARRHLAKTSFQLVLLDLHFILPSGTRTANPTPQSSYDLAGVGLAKSIETMACPPRVVVLTNVSDPEVNKQLNELTCVRCILYKHLCTPNELVRVLAKVVE